MRSRDRVENSSEYSYGEDGWLSDHSPNVLALKEPEVTRMEDVPMEISFTSLGERRDIRILSGVTA